MKTIRHWVLAFAAWWVFIVSFFLPAFDQMPGWKAAILQGAFLSLALHGNVLAVHYLLLGFANLVMIVSPFFMAWGMADRHFVKWLRGLSFAATILVWLFRAQLQVLHVGHNAGIGYYLWATSFVVLCVASLLQPIPVKVGAVQTA